MKVLAYNSSARGYGQFVRSLKIAGVITGSFADARCMILVGNSRVERNVPDRTSIVPMPEIRKSIEGDYLLGSINPAGSVPLPGSVAEAFALRRQIIQSTIDEYAPDVFLVDSRPEGLNYELLHVLRQLTRTSKCRTVLMLRDIVDDPALVTRRWMEHGTYQMIDEVYDNVVIWGDEQTFDAVAAYRLSEFQEKVTYLGYLGGGVPPVFGPDRDEAAEAPGRVGRILVTVGGGFDGGGVIRTVYDFISRASSADPPLNFTIVLGAHSPGTIADLFEHHRWPCRSIEVYRHVPELEGLISEAAVVVSMCGYNTLLELIERKKKIIAIPRSHSGAEQTMRANLLSSLYDGMWVVPQNELTVDALERSLISALRSGRPRLQMEMTGAANLVAFLSRAVDVA